MKNSDILNYLLNILKKMKQYVDAQYAQKILEECLFAWLLMNEMEISNSFVQKRFVGKLTLSPNMDVDEYLKNIKEFSKSNPEIRELFANMEQLLINKEIYNSVLEIYNIKIDKQTLSEKEYADIFMEYCIYGYRQNGSKEFFLSSSVEKLIKKISETREYKSIYDPAIGTGSLVFKILDSNKDIPIYGQDINRTVVNTCKRILILSGRISELEHVWTGNTLVEPQFIENGSLKKYDLIVSQPPISLKEWGYEQIYIFDRYDVYFRGLPPRGNADYAFISNAVERLSNTGTAILVECAGVLFRGGIEQKIRRSLVEENLIDCVIQLPGNTIYGTAIPFNLLILNKCKKETDILMIDLSIDIPVNRQLTIIPEEMIHKVVDTLKKREKIEGFSNRVTYEQVLENDYNLLAQRYVVAEKRRNLVNIKETQNEIEALTNELVKVQNKFIEYFD